MPCKMLDADAFSDDAVVEASKDLVCVLLNEDKDQMKKYKVKGYPTVLFVDPDKEEAVDELGQRDAKSVAEQMKKHSKSEKKDGKKEEGKDEK